jgi:hypothetical protein
MSDDNETPPIERLEGILDRLEGLRFADTPGQLAATDAYGNPGSVVAGELIESAWGNAVATHVVRAGPLAARPATAYIGAKWYDTATGIEYTYHPSAGWRRSDWEVSWGVLKAATASVDQVVGPGESPFQSEQPYITIAAQAGRGYRAHCSFTAQSAAATTFLLKLYNSGVVKYAWSVTIPGVQWQTVNLVSPVIPHAVTASILFSYTIGITNGGNMTIGSNSYQNCRTSVEDCGPTR